MNKYIQWLELNVVKIAVFLKLTYLSVPVLIIIPKKRVCMCVNLGKIIRNFYGNKNGENSRRRTRQEDISY